MRAWMLAFCSGVIVAGWLPRLPSLLVLLLLWLLALLLQYWPRLRLPGAALAGACWLCGWGAFSLQAWYPATDVTEDVLVQGTVWNVPVRTERSWRIQLQLDALCAGGVEPECRRLSWPERRLVQVSVYEDLHLAPGQQWQLMLRLRRPHGFANPGGFDYEVWLLQQGIAATGYVRVSPFNRQLAAASGSRPWFNRWRQALSQRLAQAAVDGPLLHSGLMQALTLGLQQNLQDAQWQQFSQLGLNHLVVISGLHIGLVAAVLYRLGLGAARCFPPLLLGLTAPRFAALWALAGVCCYAGLAGFSLPVLRALIMAAVYFSGSLLQRQTSATGSLLLALLLVLLLDPLAPQSAGFWLSFLAVAILLRQGGSFGHRYWQRLLLALRLQFLLCIGLLPVMLVYFQQGSLLAPLVNLPAIPFVGLLVVPLCLLGTALLPLWPSAATAILRSADFLLDLFMRAVTACVTWWPDSLVTLPPLDPLLLMALAAATAMVLLVRAPLGRYSALALVPLMLLLWPARRLAPGELELTVLDVGQGLAVLVRTHSQQLLYDTGPRYSERFDAGEDVLLPVLRRLGVSQLDTVIVSHADLDHAGGLAAIMARFPQARYLGSDTSIFAAGLDAQVCRPEAWQRDGFTFRLLHPDADYSNSNDGSCVLHISGSSGSALLPGDISRAVEARLLAQWPTLQADIVIAPHHGSKTSSSSAFIRRLQPQLVLYSTGYLNRFGHPAAEIRARYERAGAAALDTSSGGALRVRLAPGQKEPEALAYRQLQPRFWRRTVLPPP